MEFTSKRYWMQCLEEYCKSLVRSNQAELSKFPSHYFPEMERSRVSTKVYKVYLVNINPNPPHILRPATIAVRFWYDKRYDLAGVKITHEALFTLFKSMTVSSVLKQVGINVENGHIDPELVKGLLEKLIEERKKEKPELVATEG